MLLVFNGPPGSGKDEACEYLAAKGLIHKSFKEPLFKMTSTVFNVDHDWFMSGYNDRNVKEAYDEKLKMSRREAMIYTSEGVIKPLHGKDFFGKAFADSMLLCSDYCSSDGGFVEEITPVINKIGKNEIIIVNLFRNGRDFSSDSRKYLLTDNVISVLGSKAKTTDNFEIDQRLSGVGSYRVHNNGTIDEFRNYLDSIYEKEKNVRRKRSKTE